ncbi:uncharacterized protein [Palaemon carinicauda]|uniref:uncharacterized protein n=1 Tax=Palaemon carinicauda TaxID=392227 RepID=UPI0035B61802
MAKRRKPSEGISEKRRGNLSSIESLERMYLKEILRLSRKDKENRHEMEKIRNLVQLLVIENQERKIQELVKENLEQEKKIQKLIKKNYKKDKKIKKKIKKNQKKIQKLPRGELLQPDMNQRIIYLERKIQKLEDRLEEKLRSTSQERRKKRDDKEEKATKDDNRHKDKEDHMDKKERSF